MTPHSYRHEHGYASATRFYRGCVCNPPRYPIHCPRRGRLLHRHVHLRMVSRCLHPPLAGPGALAPGRPSPGPPGLLDMRGDPNSGGVWAPCLSWSGGLFHLVYTDMKRWTGQVKDCHNYLTTAPAGGRAVVGPRLPEQLRLRCLPLPRRRRAQVAAEHALGLPRFPERVRRNPSARVLRREEEARGREGHDLSRHGARPCRGTPPVSTRRRTTTCSPRKGARSPRTR